MAIFSRKTWHGWLGAGLLALAVAGSLAGVGWIRVWFYQLAWWGYICIVDVYIQIKQGNSLLVDRRRVFLTLCLVSAAFWFGWEMVNLRLENWFYLGVPRQIWQRWPGAFIAYATVLPGIFLTYELLGLMGLSWGRGARPIPKTRAWYPWFLGVGLLMAVLPMGYPRLFFPLVWGSFVFLLEPLNHYTGAKSLMRSWERGDLSPFVRLLLAGLVCGAFWESWNWLAEARWTYNIAYLGEPKIFAMPLAGYLGFPPFAVECYVFYASVSLLWGGRGWERDDYQRTVRPPAPLWLRRLLGLGAVAYGLWMCRMIDLHLIKGWLP
ncbi:MAG: hypothetical protein KJ720_08730 [Proteobacteria bacterium]|nr:hypothetical protein [Pseudomonadota bacterium]MBU1450753.1 hypothetical protein [Pseudomonadota bacterium]MBU2468894.1 hypothetical protein [Pseudomonadota bacterium]MBU2517648.1 hypothetical protein [Pseudomonadota bacterium]